MNEISATATVGASLGYNALQALEDTTVSYTSNGASANNQASFSGLVIPQGSIIFGSSSAIAEWTQKCKELHPEFFPEPEEAI
jgi:1-aminocyclopropane-1-carboxylate deaminase/D-cysteine desulfhydrase-like pyridoxal-dependent ACC family enzyme